MQKLFSSLAATALAASLAPAFLSNDLLEGRSLQAVAAGKPVPLGCC